MSAFYTFLSSLYNCFLKFILSIILLGEVLKILRGGAENFRRGAKYPSERCAPLRTSPPKIRPCTKLNWYYIHNENVQKKLKIKLPNTNITK